MSMYSRIKKYLFLNANLHSQDLYLYMYLMDLFLQDADREIQSNHKLSYDRQIGIFFQTFILLKYTYWSFIALFKKLQKRDTL